MSKKIRTEAVDYLFQGILSSKIKRSVIHFLKISVRLMNCFHYHSVLKLQRC